MLSPSKRNSIETSNEEKKISFVLEKKCLELIRRGSGNAGLLALATERLLEPGPVELMVFEVCAFYEGAFTIRGGVVNLGY